MEDILQSIKSNKLKTQRVEDFAQNLADMISTLHSQVTLLERKVEILEDRQQRKDAKKNKWHRGYFSTGADLPALLARLQADDSPPPANLA